MANKIIYGLEKVHIAFKGVSQTESITVTNGCTLDGELTVTVTATTLLGADSPKAVIVPVSTESHSTVAQVASAVVNVLNNNSVINAVFRASCLAGVITLTTLVAQANDATLAIAFTVGTTGVTVGASTDGTEGNVSWGLPQAIPGAVNFSPDPEGEENIFYADNIPYFVVTSNNGYKADIEMALVTDAIMAEMLGWQIDDNGLLLEKSDGTPKKFALMGQIEGDDKNRRFVYYDCQASRPKLEHKTKEEKIEPQTSTLNLTIVPIEISTRKCVKGTLELTAGNAATYNAFFNAVYVPVFA
jgi:phi13 family phage major tail protein